MKKYPRVLPPINKHDEYMPIEADGYGRDDTPFFILGCVRSGTTLLRDLLKFHPRLESPEETHFFRWADPYASPRFNSHYIGTKLFQEHRRLDGISDIEFAAILNLSRNKKEVLENYARGYLKNNNCLKARWFDKTPQNIYGISMINYMYPNAKFIHIYRHPYNVVSSLKEGKVMAKHDVKGGINYWLESMILFNEFKKMPAVESRIFEVKYEDMVANPKPWLKAILEFVGEDPSRMDFSLVKTHKEKDKYKKILSATELTYIKNICEPFFSHYGYE